MKIPTDSFRSIHKKYTAARQWMQSLGINISPGRTEYYDRILSKWSQDYQSASIEAVSDAYRDFVSAMHEVNDFISIHSAFLSHSPDDLKHIVSKLQLAVKGPIHTIDESGNSNNARNMLFEATLAAFVNQPARGVYAILNATTDTGCEIDGRKLWIECKRISSPSRLEANVRDASHQLERRLSSKCGSGHRALVALDISKLLNEGDHIYVANNDDQLKTDINYMMDNFIETNSYIWESVYRRRNKKIIGTIIRFSFMATSEERNLLVRASQWGLNPREDTSTQDKAVLKNLVEVLAASWE